MNKQALIESAMQKGIDALQIDEHYRKTTSFHLYEGQVDSFTVSDCRTWQIAGLYQGHMGKISVEQDGEEWIPRYTDAIIENALAMTSNDEVTLYEGDDVYPQIKQTKNQCLTQPIAKKIALLQEVERKLLASDTRVEQVMNLSYRDYEGSISLDNTKGLHAARCEEMTMITASLLVKEGEDQKSAYEVALLKSLDDFDCDAFAARLSQKAIAKLHAKQISSGTYPVLINNETMAELLDCLFVQFNGEQAAKGISLLKDQLNEMIFDEKVSIVDDPLMDDGIQSAPFDDEGVACRVNTLVDHGKLTAFLHNMKSAKRMRTTSSGNGFGGGISYTNLYMKNGDSAYEDMVASMDSGVIITDVSGLHAGWNPVTTQFSLQASGFYVEHGKIAFPLNLITIAGNFLELMKRVKMIGNDGKQSYTGVGSPSVLFAEMVISSE